MKDKNNAGTLIISGMHRSGTSMITSYLGSLGIELGSSLLDKDKHNPTGYFEDTRFLNFQSKILNEVTAGGEKGWPDWGYTEDNKWDDSILPKFKEEALDILSQCPTSGVWGWKDPRSTLLLDFWSDLIPDAKFLIIYRNPWEVAKSIDKLDAEVFNEHPEYALEIWEKYNKAALDFYDRHPEKCVAISANGFLQNPTKLARVLESKFGFEFEKPKVDDLSFYSSNLFYTQDITKELDAARNHPTALKTLNKLNEQSSLVGEEIITDPLFPRVSVIIPCYNMGEFVVDAVNSVARSVNLGYIDILVVNDGSDDAHTIDVLKKLEQNGTRVIHQKNQGLASARNNGIEASNTDYFIPLDADNKIEPQYLFDAISIMENTKSIGAVHSNFRMFGSTSGFCIADDFEFQKSLAYNYVDACAVIRKAAWKDVEGYDKNMPAMGYEDWDFWLSIHQKGWGISRIDKYLFDYRVRSGSMISSCNQESTRRKLINYLIEKHDEAFNKHWKSIIPNVHALAGSLQNTVAEYKNDLESSELVSELAATKTHLQNTIAAYESSFFWKLKRAYDSIKRLISRR